MTSRDPSAYLLSERRSEEIFHIHIVPTLLADAQPQSAPTLIILTAQAGAGKSTLARDIRSGFPDGARPVIVDVDSFKAFYPGYIELNKEYGVAADDLVQADARRWLDRALAYLAERRSNVIAEHGLRDWAVADALLSQFAAAPGSAAPYRIEAAFLATPSAESQLGILMRFQLGLERAGIGRYVPRTLHDARYDHTPRAATWLEADPRVAAIAVYRRGGTQPVFRNERDREGRWTQPVRAADVITAQRDQPLSIADSRAFLRLHASLAARMHPSFHSALAAASAAAEPLLHPGAATPRRDRPAVTFGRYQIVSIAHLDTIRTILMDWPTVEIGILDLDTRPHGVVPIPPHLEEFYRDCEANVRPEKNPMTAQERAGFWEAALNAAGLQDRATVRIIPRPELTPAEFNRLYPADQVDLVFPTASGEGFDRIRNASFETILSRRVHTVDPPLEYHTSDIRAAYRAGNEAWRNGFAPGGLQAFIDADGPRRLLALTPGTDATSARTAATVAMRALASRARPPSSPPAQGRSDSPSEGPVKLPPDPTRRPGPGRGI